MDTVFGLPTHVLVVHLSVVLLPLAALIAVAIVVVARWRRAGGSVLVGLTAIGTASTFVAAASGERFEKRIDLTAAVTRHEDLGRSMRIVALLFLVASIGYVVGHRRISISRARPPTPLVSGVLAVVLLAAALASTVWVVRAGHSGAVAVWKGVGETKPGG